ncbi:MAG TPA: carbon storage regulator CsrA [Acidobacteriota bacterium]|nr:carbon storage regulator CsrA [Acidobacteriota bacterium]
MLVVTRKLEESIVIGNEIEVVVLRIDRHAVRIGVKAPRHISVHRKEIFEEIRQANIAAAASQEVEIAALQRLIGDVQKKEKSAPPESKKADDPGEEQAE